MVFRQFAVLYELLLFGGSVLLLCWPACFFAHISCLEVDVHSSGQHEDNGDEGGCDRVCDSL